MADRLCSRRKSRVRAGPDSSCHIGNADDTEAMRITYLIEDATRIWGGVKAVFDAANALHARGHDVTIVSRSAGPTWTQLNCTFAQSPSFDRRDIPESDVVVATFWTTVSPALAAQRGPVVHYCQGYEGDNPEAVAHRTQIEEVYRSGDTHLLTISPNLEELLREKFDRKVRRVRYAIDHGTMYPADARPAGSPVRVGLVGPYEIAWKDLRTGLEACQLAHAAGLPIELVRITNTEPHPDEKNLGLPIEWHENVPPAEMGALYRSLDVFLGTSRGAEEGFFLPAVEAMACGVPSVLTEIPCFQAYGTSQYALFVTPQSPKQMAEALVLAAMHPDVRNEIRDNGIRVASEYTMENHVSELESAFAEIAAEAGGPSRNPLVMSVPDNRRQRIEQLATSTRAMCATCTDVVQLEQLSNELQAALQSEFLHQRGLLEYSAGHLEAALASFRDALDGSTDPAELLNDLGVALYATHDFDGAVDTLERALEINPLHPDAGANLDKIRTAAATR